MITKASLQTFATAVALLVALCMLVLPGASDDARALETDSFVPGQIVVKLEPRVGIGDLNLRVYGLRVQERFLNQTSTDIYLLSATDGASAQSKLNAFLGNPLVSYAELNYLSDAPEAGGRHHAFPAENATPTTRNYSSKDAAYPDSALNLTAAREVSQGAGTRVAVLDTGAQLNHPALKANFAGVPRYDFVDDDTDPSEPALSKNKQRLAREVVGHGTHVAGIIDLVAPQAEVMPLRVLDREGYGTTFHVAEAIAYAGANEADVINLSLGTPSWSTLLREKVDKAIRDGVVVVAAAGNHGSPQPQYPASNGPLLWVASKTDGLLAVSSVSAAEKKSDFANWGEWVDIVAPGEGILSTYPVSKYAYWSGTSMATPFVAGEAALIHSADGSLEPGGVEDRIRLGARCVDQKNLPDVPSGEPGVPLGSLGDGHANVYASLMQDEGPRCIDVVNP